MSLEIASKSEPRRRGSEGTQAISRSVLILRLIARWGVEGCRLTDLTKTSGIPHPTLRRILVCLIEEGFVVQDEATRRYRLGPLNYELGLATIHRNDFQSTLTPTLQSLARQSGDTVYLNVRSRAEQVCLNRVEGHSVIRAVTQEIGGRRPLVFGSSGLAIMASLADSDIADVIDKNAHDIENHPRLTVESIWRAVAKTRDNGYAIIRDTTVIGVSAIGVIAPSSAHQPAMAVSLAMVNERLTPARARDLYKLMTQELHGKLKAS